MTVERWSAAIEDDGSALAATAVDALGLDVPTCPEWTVHDLLGHVGAVHRWAADCVSGADRRRGLSAIEVPTGAEVLTWYVAGRDELLAALADRSPDDLVKTFVGERPATFWYRRQANELAIHRWDLESATRPGEQRTIDVEQAADIVDEWLALFVPRFVELGPGVPSELVGRTLHLHGTDDDVTHDTEWFWTVTPTGFEYRREHAKADAAVRAAASDLALAVYHRRSLADLDVVGDTDTAAAILDLIHIS
ncbi:TIGR03083 family protein [Williamsia sterculiae]|uniref:TIGR03083 family protein n=2 Tax=Williamsia sterculiae TaxID=1344003 RepID=A0A1N7FQI0_9NOCA|nr:TIGR03083 family protein [Williamsia sterculiae]